MSKRYEHLHYCEYRDTETGLVASNYVEVMNEQDQQIKDLEHRLSECIEPKFTIGQEVWGIDVIRKDNIDSFIVREICYCADYGLYYKTDIGVNVYEYYYKLFATEEEAKARLREMQDE